jgi:hypothetical protein
VREFPDDRASPSSVAFPLGTAGGRLREEETVATLVLLLSGVAGDPSIGPEAAARLADLGVTHVSLLRDGETVAVVLDGWAFDPVVSSAAVRGALGASGPVRALYPLAHVSLAGSRRERRSS